MTRSSNTAAERARQRAVVPSSLTQRTGFLLSTLGRRARAATERALAPVGITPQQYGVMVVIAAHGPAPQAAVGATLQIDKSSMVVVIDQLERLGMVERQPNARDRRVHALVLTAAGHAALVEADSIIAHEEETTLAVLDPDQRAQLHALLLQLLGGS